MICYGWSYRNIIYKSLKKNIKNKNKMRNCDLFHKIIFVDAKDADELKSKRDLLERMRYDLVDHSLTTNNDIIHLVFKRIKKYKIYKCLVKAYDNDYDDLCNYYFDKCCTADSSCIDCPYIGTNINIAIIKKQVKMFEELNKLDNNGYIINRQFIDTIYGKIFSLKYSNLYEKYDEIMKEKNNEKEKQ